VVNEEERMKSIHPDQIPICAYRLKKKYKKPPIVAVNDVTLFLSPFFYL
jgi:hypothetical protein